MSELQNSLLELIRRTSAEIPDDVQSGHPRVAGKGEKGHDCRERAENH